MNEGKPTKAKWWNRPRPESPEGQAEGATAPVPGATADGDYELRRPQDMAGDEPVGTASVQAVADADANPDADAGATGSDATRSGGDFELRAPRDAAGTESGDFELDRPAAAPVEAAADAPVPRADAAAHAAVVLDKAPATDAASDAAMDRAPATGATGEAVMDLDRALATDAASDAAMDLGRAPATGATGEAVMDLDRAPATDAAADLDRTPATDATADRPKPLHDPDPYSTPPYGEPGPWAPAPPVQHPATTPSHGTAIPAPTQALGTPVPGSPHGTPVPTPPPGPLATPHPTAAAAPVNPAPQPPQGTPVPPSGPGTPAPAPPTPSYMDAPPPAAYAEPRPPAANPWQNYDPWAPVPIPLQQTGAAAPTQEKRRRRVRKLLVVGAVVLALVSGGIGGAVGAYLERNGGVGAVELPQADAEPAGRAPDSVAGIAARALPSVVTLHVSGAGEQGTGTGFVLDDRGHILTNNHVVEPAGADGDISVTFHSGDTAEATVVGRDSGYDLAVVKVTGVSGLKPMTLGNSDSVQVGDPVVAIGAPYDLEGTVTSGIISAKERPITAGGESGDGSDVSYVDALQTDAPINPGNSGGPLLDSKARVIGINSAIRSADSGSDESVQSGSIGLGFAIPVNQAKRVAEELINTGKATHPVIGVTLDMEYAGDGARVGTKGNDGGPAVNAGGPGDKAGIEAGDVITEVDGQRIHSGEELIVKTRAHRPGDELELTVERDGKEMTISLVLGSSDGN